MGRNRSASDSDMSKQTDDMDTSGVEVQNDDVPGTSNAMFKKRLLHKYEKEQMAGDQVLLHFSLDRF